MWRNSAGLAFAALLAASAAQADTIEAPFKDICNKLVALDKQTQANKIDDPLWVSKSTEYRDALKKLVTQEPSGVWADDAQYLVARLSTVDRTDVVEKERFLAYYPDGAAEAWTMQTLDYLVPAKLSLDLSMRMELCKDYLKRGDRQKLSRLCQESALKYPDKEVWFKTMGNKSG